MVQVNHLGGRLVGFRIIPPVIDENSGRARAELASAIVSVPGPVLLVCDLRAARTFAPKTFERFVGLMKSGAGKMQRNGLLLNGGMSTLALQITRMIKESGHEGQEVFTDPKPLFDWFKATTTASETEALTTFLRDPITVATQPTHVDQILR